MSNARYKQAVGTLYVEPVGQHLASKTKMAGIVTSARRGGAISSIDKVPHGVYAGNMAYTGEQKREYQRKWLAKRRQAWIDEQGGKCAKCGSTDRLEVDHKDRTTKSCDPGMIWSRNADFRLSELAKCQVLCYDCHLMKTSAEWDGLAEHGTNQMYNSRKCRCELCKAAHAALAKATRASGKKW